MKTDSSSTTTTQDNIDNVDIAAVGIGKKYSKRFLRVNDDDDGNDGDEYPSPWLDDNAHWTKCLEQNQWTRWDGTMGTAQEHMKWMQQQAKSLFSAARADEFRLYGQHDGCQYYLHNELTRQGDGFGCFKIEGRVFDIEPCDLLRLCFDMTNIPVLDVTAVYYKMAKPYPIIGSSKASLGFSSYVAPVYWSNDPGFPFSFRDGIDLTGFITSDQDDDDGDESSKNTIWQVACGVDLPAFQSQPGAIKATDRYWAYRLEKVGPQQTKVSIICQCCLNGWIPRFLSNYYVCKVLIDSLSKMEKAIAQLKAEDPQRYKERCAKMGLNNL